MTKYRLKKRFYSHDGSYAEPQVLESRIPLSRLGLPDEFKYQQYVALYCKNEHVYNRQLDKEFVEHNTEFFEQVNELPKTYQELVDSVGGEQELEQLRPDAEIRSGKAYWKLLALVRAYNGDWEPDWDNQDQPKYCISARNNKLIAWEAVISNIGLAFKTPELRNEFLKNFEDLIKEFYMIEK